MRVKILDAWTWGLPMVSTTIGAEGIAVRPGEDILIGDDPKSFADCTVRLLQDAELGTEIASGGRSTVVANYDWRTRYGEWNEVYA